MTVSAQKPGLKKGESEMNLLWLFIALIGLGVLCWAAVQYALNRKRRKGAAPLMGAGALVFGLGMALSAALPSGLEIPGGSMTHMGAMTGEAGKLGFSSPLDLEKLDLQDFLVTGNGKADEELELYEGENKLGQFTVGKDGTWSWPIGGKLVTEGDHTYELRAVGGAMGSGQKLTVNIAKGRPEASNAKCPCRLRITSLEKQNVKDAAITLLKDGKVIEVGSDPQVFGNLEEGEYTYSVTAPGFETFSSGKAFAPKNKNISVYLKPAR
jgi:hypothetical protein